jgi:hypothetical protein
MFLLGGCGDSNSPGTGIFLAGIQVTPAKPSIASDTKIQFTATGINSDNTTQDLTSQVTWASSSTGTATINSAGTASGVAAGWPSSGSPFASPATQQKRWLVRGAWL